MKTKPWYYLAAVIALTSAAGCAKSDKDVTHVKEPDILALPCCANSAAYLPPSGAPVQLKSEIL